MQGAWDTGTWDAAQWDSLPLAGNSASGSPGSVGTSTTVSISGNGATGQVGSVASTVTVAITGNEATGQVGTVSYAADVSITGNTATGYPGEGNPAITVAISGAGVLGQVGSVTVQPVPVVVVSDGHDGKKFKKHIERERKRNEARRRAVIDAYERIVEGRPELAEEIVAPFVKTTIVSEKPRQVIDYDALFADLDRVQRIWDAHLDIDDEEVLTLL